MFKLNKLTAAIIFTGVIIASPAISVENNNQRTTVPVVAASVGESSYPNFNALAAFDPNKIYNISGTRIKYNDGERHGVFSNKWYIQGEAPDFDSSNGVWELVARTDATGKYLSEIDSMGIWNVEIAYVGGVKVKHVIDGVTYIFEARGWVKGEAPILLAAGEPEWKSTWKKVGQLDGEVNPDKDTPPSEEPPAPEEETTTPGAGESLPTDEYAFLNDLTNDDWNWLFPLRSGLFNPQGDVRNRAPIALPDGSTDVYTLEAFKAAVMEYNNWANANGHKNFLNEGSKSLQATEFVAFMAKTSRETSGTWANAPAPWIVTDKDAGTVWKGGLYWTEETGYSTDANGISPSINYVDASSVYRPVPGRSYHGRGVIQLSWNYNYGNFSKWLYENGLMKDVITAPDTLLHRPDLVASNGKLSVMSGIWFWMTPQGAKPSSHDVVYGDVTNVSTSSQELGLPPRNDGGAIEVFKGETQNQAVVAYRIGTVINIVNGGLECNNAASWHAGPMQRVSYYNAYSMYMNANQSDITVPVIDAGVNVWTSNVTAQSHDNLKIATCYAQKSYYTW